MEGNKLLYEPLTFLPHSKLGETFNLPALNLRKKDGNFETYRFETKLVLRCTQLAKCRSRLWSIPLIQIHCFWWLKCFKGFFLSFTFKWPAILHGGFTGRQRQRWKGRELAHCFKSNETLCKREWVYLSFVFKPF